MRAHTYFYWDDIEMVIRDKMGIDKEHFRSYHKVVGGEYKDLWHVTIFMFYDEINNGSLKSSCDRRSDEGVIKEYGGWVKPYLEAYEEVTKRLGLPDILFSW